jgi:phosphatidylserine/phosphatidylglycerophosphate/cardiolipin synthase-like enzyme
MVRSISSSINRSLKFRLMAGLALLWVAPLALAGGRSSDITSSFNYSTESTYTDPWRRISRPGDNFEELILSALRTATQTVDMAVQEIRVPSIAKELVRLQKKGVRVRLVIEHEYNFSMGDLMNQRSKSEDHESQRQQDYVQLIDVNKDGKLSEHELLDRDAVYILKRYRIPMIDDTNDGSRGTGLMHHKFVVIDGRRLVVTTANFTLSDFHGDLGNLKTRGNANSFLTFDHAPLAKIFSEEFSLMWGNGPAGKKSSLFGANKPYRAPQTVVLPSGAKVTVQFSGTQQSRPWSESVAGLIGKTLSNARQSVDVALFVFSEQQISNQLEKVVDQRNVKLRALVEPKFAFRPYSKLLDMWGLDMLDVNCKRQEGRQLWTSDRQEAGIPELENGDYLHHKFAVMDRRTVIVGSFNWSDSANYSNDETLIVIEDRPTAESFSKEFERQLASAKLGLPSWLEKKAEDQRRACKTQND